MRLQQIVPLFLAVLFFSAPSARAAEFTCANTASWHSMASNSVPYDFRATRIKPDGSPSRALSREEKRRIFYPSGAPVVDVVRHPECFAAVSCPDNYYGAGPFRMDHPVWRDSRCSCSHFPQSGCSRVTWRVKNNPSLDSGPVGSPMPPHPPPVVPSEWNERYIYSRQFPPGTEDGAIASSIESSRDEAYVPSGGSVSAVKCSEGFKTIDGWRFVEKFYLLSGLSTYDQSFQTRFPGVDHREDWGVCGVVHQRWSDGPVAGVSRPARVRPVPVVVYVSSPTPDELAKEYEFVDRPIACPSGSNYADGTCRVTVSPGSSGLCPSGFRKVRGFGFSFCQKSIGLSYGPCPSGSEIVPGRSSGCRREVARKEVKIPTITLTKTPSQPEPQPGGETRPEPDGETQSAPPRPLTDLGLGSEAKPVSVSTPSWCIGERVRWDASSGVCRMRDGGGVVHSGGPPTDSSGKTVVSFGDAPAAGDSTGTRSILEFGLYKPVYGPDVKLSDFVQSEMAKLDNTTVRTRLTKFLPPPGRAALPKRCFHLTSSSEEFCLDLNPYSSYFDVVGNLLLILSSFVAYRIVIGA